MAEDEARGHERAGDDLGVGPEEERQERRCHEEGREEPARAWTKAREEEHVRQGAKCEEDVRDLERLELVPAGEAQEELGRQDHRRVGPEVDAVEPPIRRRYVVAQRPAEVPLEGMAHGDPPEGQKIRRVNVGRTVVEEGLRGEQVLGAVGVRRRPLADRENERPECNEEEGCRVDRTSEGRRLEPPRTTVGRQPAVRAVDSRLAAGDAGLAHGLALDQATRGTPRTGRHSRPAGFLPSRRTQSRRSGSGTRRRLVR